MNTKNKTDSGASLWLTRITWAIAVGLIGYVVTLPFVVSPMPMITDFPFHVANSSIIANLSDPAMAFDQQFELHLFGVPYFTFYGIAAVAMHVVGPVAATKFAAGVMLLLMPAGLMVLCWGMRKSPLLGLWALPFVWTSLTHWGFLNFMGALGLFAMTLGVALRAVDAPSRGNRLALIGCLLLVFGTHVFRFPFAICAVVATGVVMFAATRRWRPLVVPVVLSAALFIVWWTTRPTELGAGIDWVSPQWSRLADSERYIANTLVGSEDEHLFRRAFWLFVAVAGALLTASLVRFRQWSNHTWLIGSHVVVLGCIGVFAGLFLMMPMSIGIWWYVFPREITAAAFLVPALMPNLPASRWSHLAFVTFTAFAVVPGVRHIGAAHAEFGEITKDFRAITDHISTAPKLMYLVYDHSGTRAVSSPFVHLSGYVQATRGGWLSFQFANARTTPIWYRDDGVLPPTPPLRWEWTPQRFDVSKHGPFFDWFLVRSRRSPAHRFEADKNVDFVAREGRWWLFRRALSATGPQPDSP